MDYEKKIREYMVSSKVDQLYKSMLINLFPELAESEDEKIRKALISVLKSDFENDTTIHDISVGDILAWLERQSEQKQPKELTNSEFVEKCKGLSRLEQHILALVPTRPIDAIKVDARTIRYLVEQEQGEQKPVEWSEEDEQYLLVCKNALNRYQMREKRDAEIISKWLEEKLKSIRPQKQWKPSEEQINAIGMAITFVTDDFSDNPTLSEILKDLQNQLKAL